MSPQQSAAHPLVLSLPLPVEIEDALTAARAAWFRQFSAKEIARAVNCKIETAERYRTGSMPNGPQLAAMLSHWGPAFLEAGNTTPTINDVNLLLGILNEDNYLGDKIHVNKDVSYRLFKEKVADPLDMDVYVAAETCLGILNVMMREHLVNSLMVGHDLREYVLLGYGGGGPLHLLGERVAAVSFVRTHAAAKGRKALSFPIKGRRAWRDRQRSLSLSSISGGRAWQPPC